MLAICFVAATDKAVSLALFSILTSAPEFNSTETAFFDLSREATISAESPSLFTALMSALVSINALQISGLDLGLLHYSNTNQ